MWLCAYFGGLQEANPGKSCVNVNSVKDWKTTMHLSMQHNPKKINIVPWANTSGTGNPAITMVGHEDWGRKKQWLLWTSSWLPKVPSTLVHTIIFHADPSMLPKTIGFWCLNEDFEKKKKSSREHFSVWLHGGEKNERYFFLRMGLTMARIL